MVYYIFLKELSTVVVSRLIECVVSVWWSLDGAVAFLAFVPIKSQLHTTPANTLPVVGS
jgi:hypothetical protein